MVVAVAFGAQVRRGDEVGYFLAYVEDEYSGGETDIRVFHPASGGMPTESRTRADNSGWAPTGKMADAIVLASMNLWQAEQDRIHAIGSMLVCQKCGGRIGAKDDCDRCFCDAPTMWRSRRLRRALGEPDPDYEAMVDEEWDGMYRDVITGLCFSAARIPDEKLTVELFRRLLMRETAGRESLAQAWEDHEDFNSVWATMLQRIARAPHAHLTEMLRRLPTVRAQIARQGGRSYAQGQDALGRREVEFLQKALDVDERWDPR